MLKTIFDPPCLVALVASIFGIALAISSICASCHNFYAYPIDDAFIYMAMAKTLSQHGVWGVTRFEFSGASSAHLWTVLLAIIFKIIGPQYFVPLVLNVIFSLLLVVASARFLAGYNVPKVAQTVILLTVVILICVPSLTVLGMEHVLHSMLTVLFFQQAVQIFDDNQSGLKDITKRRFIFFALTTILFCACRYESLFLIGIFAFVLIVRKRFIEALVLLALGMTPVFAYALFSTLQGGLFFPNSILLKGRIGFGDYQQESFLGLAGFLETGWKNLFLLWPAAILSLYSSIAAREDSRWKRLLRGATIAWCTIMPAFILMQGAIDKTKTEVMAISLIGFACTALVAVVALLLIFDYRNRPIRASSLHIFILAFISHAILVGMGKYFYRYEAYILILGALVIGATIAGKRSTETTIAGSTIATNGSVETTTAGSTSRWKRTWSVLFGFSLALSLIGLGERLFLIVQRIPYDAQWTYNQHRAIGLFLKKYFDDSTVVVHDIGTVTYYPDNIKVVDLWGLASVEVTRAKHDSLFFTDFIRGIANKDGADIAVLQYHYPEAGGLPPEWKKIGSWSTIPVGGKSVTFYAVKPEAKEKLQNALNEYKLDPPNKLMLEQ